MNKTILATASVIALVISMPAVADTSAKTKTEASAETNTTGDIGNDAKEAWKNIKEDASEAYEDIKAVFVDKDNKPVVISTRNTATGMIGHAVYNATKERVGTVKDIIVDGNGNASMLVVSDGEFPGFDGKLVAFDYSIISSLNADGDVIAPISEDNISKAAEFSYDKNAQADGKVRVIPDRGYSVARLLDGQLVNPQGDSVAEIDDISFKNAKASDLIVGFEKVLGLGGKKAALSYDAAQIVRDGEDLDFKLSAAQAAQFEAYKKTATN